MSVKIILRIMKTILRIVVLETGYAERSRKYEEILPSAAKNSELVNIRGS